MVVGNSRELLQEHADDAEVILNGMNQGARLKDIWLKAKSVKWVHSLSAGVEGTLFPELIESPVPITNARGVFKDSLGEFVIASIMFFAKDLRRMVRSQAESRWDQYDVEMVTGKTLGIVGYGEIGRAAAKRGHALGMKVLALRRNPARSKDDSLISKAFPMEQRAEMIAQCDYVVVAAPLTHQTRGLVGDAEIRAMRPGAVIVNVGRGPVISEAALIDALHAGRIRGAALDVFDVEPLPQGHPFWSMENVLLSPHTADRTATWLHEAMQFFVENFERYANGEPLQNVVDKKAGY